MGKERLSITLEPEDRAYVEEKSERTKRPVSQIIREMVSDAIKRDKQNKAFVEGDTSPGRG